MMVYVVLGSIICGQLITRFGNYKILLIIGSGIATVGVLLLSTMNPHSNKNVILAFMTINGLGDGFIMLTCQIAIQNAFQQEMVGTATASFQFFKNLGSSIGLAFLGAILAKGTTAKIIAVNGSINSLNTSIHNIFIVCVCISVVTIIASIFVKHIAIRKNA